MKQKNKEFSVVYMYVAPQWMFDAMNSIRSIKVPLNIDNLMEHLMSDSRFRNYKKGVKLLVNRIKKNGLWSHLATARDELNALNTSIDYIESELNLNVIIRASTNVDYDPKNKAQFALPGKVSIYLE